MSLVNQMLRDLEARRKREEVAAPRAEVHAVEARQSNPWRWLAGLLILIIVAGGGIYFGSSLHRNENDKTIATAPASTPMAANNAKPEPTNSRPDALAQNVVTPTAAVATASRHKHSKNDTPKQADHIATATKATPDAQPVVVHSAVATTTPEPARKTTPHNTAVTQPATQHKKQAAKKPAKHSPAKHKPVTHSTLPRRMTKTPHRLSPAEKAAAAYAAGITATQTGQPVQAEQHFRAALTANPAAYKAREALAATLAKQGRTTDAIKVFETGMRIDPPHRALYARLYARLLVASGHTAQAITVLQHNRPKAAGAPQYYAFIAALQERKGQHDKAIKNYKKALTVNPREGRWWAGLAVSYEQSRQPNKALAAYQRARQAGGLGVTLATYVNKRITALTP